MIISQVAFIRKNTKALAILFFLSFIINGHNSFAQAGIYDETDIEFQSMFIEAQLEKVKGNTDKQISILKNVLKRDKSSHATYFELAKAYIDIEDYEAAVKNAKKAIQFDASNVFYLKLLADAFERDNQFQSANDTYKTLIGLDNDNFEYYDKMAFNEMVIGQPKSAVATLENWQTKSGISGAVSYKLFDIYNGLGDSKNALAVLNKLANEFPTNTKYLIKKARYLLFTGEKKEALNTYNKVLEIDPQNQTALLAKTEAEIKSNPSNSSLANLSSLVDNNNISLDAKIKALMPYMAKMPLGAEDNKALKSMSKTLVDSYPNEAKSHAVRADVLFYLSDFSESEKSYSNAIKLDDKKYAVWDQWILNLWELGNYAKMETTAMDAIDYFPNQVSAYLYHAIASQKNNNKDDATDMLEEATFISGNNTKYKPLLNIISNWINIDNLTKDQVSYNIGNIKDKQIISALYFELLGDIYKQISDNVKSKSYFESAIKLGANSERINKKIGV